jgi:hypothetical protein
MKRLLLGLSAIVALIIASPAVAAECGPRDQVIELLSQGYAEQPVARGMRSNGTMAELWLSPGGSWTVLISSPAGVACVAFSGDQMDLLPIVRGQPG